MIYADNRQNKMEVTEEFISELEKVCDYVLKEEKVECKYQISLLCSKAFSKDKTISPKTNSSPSKKVSSKSYPTYMSLKNFLFG